MEIKTIVIPSYGVYYPPEEVAALKEENALLTLQIKQMEEKIKTLESKQKPSCLLKL